MSSSLEPPLTGSAPFSSALRGKTSDLAQTNQSNPVNAVQPVQPNQQRCETVGNKDSNQQRCGTVGNKDTNQYRCGTVGNKDTNQCRCGTVATTIVGNNSILDLNRRWPMAGWMDGTDGRTDGSGPSQAGRPKQAKQSTPCQFESRGTEMEESSGVRRYKVSI